MNAEVSIELDLTTEVDTNGIVLTAFLGTESEGEVHTFSWAQIIEDMLETSTYSEDGEISPADVAYIINVADTLIDVGNRLKAKVASD